MDLDALADEIENSTARLTDADRGFYIWSSLAEARISRKNWSGAAEAVNEMLSAADADVFKLGSTLRQFKTV